MNISIPSFIKIIVYFIKSFNLKRCNSFWFICIPFCGRIVFAVAPDCKWCKRWITLHTGAHRSYVIYKHCLHVLVNVSSVREKADKERGRDNNQNFTHIAKYKHRKIKSHFFQTWKSVYVRVYGCLVCCLSFSLAIWCAHLNGHSSCCHRWILTYCSGSLFDLLLVFSFRVLLVIRLIYRTTTNTTAIVERDESARMCIKRGRTNSGSNKRLRVSSMLM